MNLITVTLHELLDTHSHMQPLKEGYVQCLQFRLEPKYLICD